MIKEKERVVKVAKIYGGDVRKKELEIPAGRRGAFKDSKWERTCTSLTHTPFPTCQVKFARSWQTFLKMPANTAELKK